MGVFGQAFLLTLLAGVATAGGAAAAFFARRTNVRMLAVALGFSGGVMIFISFVELFGNALHELRELAPAGTFYAMLAFFGGMALACLIDRIVPETGNPHEMRPIEEMKDSPADSRKLHQVGIRFAAAVALHKFPEGLAVFASALGGLQTGIPVALAMALHNIPEGIAVSVPVYYATGSRKKAFLYASLTGLADPLGGLLGYWLLAPFLTNTVLNIIYAAVAGVMVFVAVDGLLPMAHKYGEHHVVIYSLMTGMAFMALGITVL